MAQVPPPIHATVPAIYRWYEQQESAQKPRPYLGASQIGRRCERELWLSFRWVSRPQFDGRMLRLFRRGQREEAAFVEDLRAIGVIVHDVDRDGRQFTVEAHGGHFRGHLDGAAVGIPEAPGTWHVLEFKTHNSKSFDKLTKDGVQKAKPEHYAQMQVYMGLTGMKRALYLAVCKDDDRMHAERIEIDQQFVTDLLARAERIIFAAEPPPRISTDPAWWECKYCDFRGTCFGTDAPIPTCRSCAHSTPERDGTWSCERHGKRAMQAQQQLDGCMSHRVIPPLLAGWADMVDASQADNWVRYRTADGREFVNDEQHLPGHYTSAELHDCADKNVLADPQMDALRTRFGGRIGG